MATIDTARPRMLVMENVDELESMEGGNSEFLYEMLTSKKYSVGQHTMISSSYGTPQRRKRTRSCQGGLPDFADHGRAAGPTTFTS